MDAEETLSNQAWCLSASARLTCSDDGLIVFVRGKRFVVNLGSRHLEELVLDGLRTQAVDKLLGEFSRKCVGAALASLRDLGAIVPAQRVHRVNLFDANLVEAPPPSLEDRDLLLIVTAALDPRVGPLLSLARNARAPCLLAWTAGSTVVLAHDDGTHRPCVGCALLFDTALLSASATLDFERTPLADVAFGLASQMAAPGVALPEPGRALVLSTSPWQLSWHEFMSHPSCPCRTRLRYEKRSGGEASTTTTGEERFGPILRVQDSDGQRRPAKVLFRRDQEPGAQRNPSVGVASAAGVDADQRATAEGVERFCMLHARPTVERVKASALPLPALADGAIRSLLFREEEMSREGFRLRAYTPDEALDWSLARDALTEQALMVPTSLVGRPPSGHPRLVDATSSGYAAHPRAARAAEAALLEVIERDAVLLSWFLDLETPVLDLSVSELAPGSDRVKHAAALLATRDIDIPVVWILAILDDGSLYSASSASLSFADALAHCQRELLAALQRSRSKPLATHVAPRLDDVRQKHGPVDHLSWWRDPTRAGSLVERKARSARVRATDCALRWPAHADDGDGARKVAERLARAGLTAYLVDRSLPEVFGAGWAVVRALVPGTVELSWGQGYRRLASPRIQHLLAQGCKLNEQPHPVA